MLLPALNRADVEEIPDEVRRSLEIQLIEHVDEAFAAALLDRVAPATDAPIDEPELVGAAADGEGEA